eukprot:sb/3472879/
MGWSSIVLLTVLAASVSGIRRTILHNVEIGPVKPDKGDTVNFKLYLKDSWSGETIVEPDSVDLTADAATIRKAVKGWGTDEKAIINVLANRRYNTRLMLSNVYEREFDRTLWGDIKSDTSGDFRNALKGLVMTEAQFLAEEMRSAMVQGGDDDSVNTVS